MARSVFLRGFDQQMAALVVEDMERGGTHFLKSCEPKNVESVDNGRLRVTWANTAQVNVVSSFSLSNLNRRFDATASPTASQGTEHSDEYDTVLLATGRDPCTSGLGLEAAGVQLCQSTGKVLTDAAEESVSAPGVFALGDVAKDRPELTPAAIRAGTLLGDRLYGGKKELMDYKKVPTAVFTPLEYACVGQTEEEALEVRGEHGVEVYHSYFKPLEWALPGGEDNACYAKMICSRDGRGIIGQLYGIACQIH